MKKRISLFLALLMVFSVLFATSAEAAQQKQEVNEQPQSVTSTAVSHEEVTAPRVTDPVGDTINQVQGPGPYPCNHNFWIRPYNATTHVKYCTKCNTKIYIGHTWINCVGRTHYCSKCGYSTAY